MSGAMGGHADKGAASYHKLGLESQVLTSSPEQIITLLFDGAENAIKLAKIHMESGNIPLRGKAISRALDIINRGLLAGINHERGGDLAINLTLIYDYVCQKLLDANRHSRIEDLNEAERILNNISSAWREMVETAAREAG